ncbi:MAG: hypothetical protein COW24_01520 [Candidatus Kerfeldbacteria bacterium CG15_BIG_FIL_POST_REV_8_21_14_020_45_12]|uniref:Uncharacterized protein n=1 Tax=Candidatus Kerfeldbacteria bacterium CG15_BIG_FIL_POST_REV_8_21_14_020_45_12 TaxID=2014247 RepID=A0A2M7H4P5_9BACT|nr:MAG: hypothetical protein COW24_01520 [Candidatus Kerfeldbacteria bacterium CG15_BIG_FIL_POST_REV_8_21_14_020_45_12]PJA93592.1 MAG: hypothetical protein CO132_02305 [Candidatus Kerfeldbacteria bacterium CG_4_9_14_3_um_filter_45_8]
MRSTFLIINLIVLVILIPLTLSSELLEHQVLNPEPLKQSLTDANVYDEIVPLSVKSIFQGEQEALVIADLKISQDRVVSGLRQVFPSSELQATGDRLISESYRLTNSEVKLSDLNLAIPLGNEKDRLRTEVRAILEEIGAKRPPSLPDCTDGEILRIALQAGSSESEDISFSDFQNAGCWPSSLIGSSDSSMLLRGVPISPELIAGQLPSEINLLKLLIADKNSLLDNQNSTTTFSKAELARLEDLQAQVEGARTTFGTIQTTQTLLWIIIGIFTITLIIQTLTSPDRMLWWLGLLFLLTGGKHLGLGLITKYFLPSGIIKQIQLQTAISTDLLPVLERVLVSYFNQLSYPLILIGLLGLVMGISLMVWSRTIGHEEKSLAPKA